ncbi:MAG TPA: pyruvate kinase [Candidatus Paceibacterota bacterium]
MAKEAKINFGPAKKTKIVCTIGPVTSSEEKLGELLKEGMNVMRLNFSHGDFAEHQVKVDNLKKATAKTGIPCATLQDLGGPKIRIGEFEKGAITLKEGQTFTLTTDKIVGNEERVSVNYEPLPKEVKVGGYILLHDGKKKLQVTAIKGKEVVTKVVAGGEIKSRRGVNLPGAYLSISSLTTKDKSDLEFGIKNNVDFVAFSFVRRASDVHELRGILQKAGMKDTKIIAKIEDVEGLENFDELLTVVDGVMVARGDLAIEIGAENVPMNQKMMIKKCNQAGKIVITATHMLESMIKNPVPTRAEVSDIANAVLDGTDAIMLSEETTLGDYPVEAVKVMTTVVQKIETHPMYEELAFDLKTFEEHLTSGVTVDAVTSEVVDVAKSLDAKCIVALSNHGKTARMIARYKPTQDVYVFTPYEKTCRQMLLTFGCTAVKTEKFIGVREALPEIKKYLQKHKIANKGDRFVLAAAMPLGEGGDTNMVLVETI